ncbi:MAG: hypothetical protein GXP42_11715 [Chloroflexi bacterium]|nr:hypothetical protein [Chloroflexota bacterium]
MASNDDGGQGYASRLEWRAAANAPLFIKVRHYSALASGPNTRYDIRVIESRSSSIQNGNFERGRSGWEEISLQGFDLIMHVSETPVLPHSGEWLVWLGGAMDEVSYIRQEVTVPPTAPYLGYWHWIASEDVCGYDFGGVGINGEWYAPYNLCSTANTNGWSWFAVDLSEFAGQTIYLDIVAVTDGSLNSSLFIDDVAFVSSAKAPNRRMPEEGEKESGSASVSKFGLETEDVLEKKIPSEGLENLPHYER